MTVSNSDFTEAWSFISNAEYAEYTSAQERIALGKKSRKLEAKKRRDEMHEMIAEAYVMFRVLSLSSLTQL